MRMVRYCTVLAQGTLFKRFPPRTASVSRIGSFYTLQRDLATAFTPNRQVRSPQAAKNKRVHGYTNGPSLLTGRLSSRNQIQIQAVRLNASLFNDAFFQPWTAFGFPTERLILQMGLYKMSVPVVIDRSNFQPFRCFCWAKRRVTS